MNGLRTAIRESLLLLTAATLLGFSYTAIAKKGLFAETGSASLPPPSPPMISLQEVQAIFHSGEAVFIDARHAYDYRLGHIKGAINIPLAEYERMNDIVRAIPKEKLIVVYCDGAECNSSIQFAVKLSSEGFTNVKIFFGGWREWEAEKLPTEKATL